MNYLKRFYKPFLYTLAFLTFFAFLTTLLSYTSIITTKILIFSKIFISILSFFLGGLLIGKTSCRKGYLDGIKFGMIISFLMLIINIILKKFNPLSIIYYIILIFSSTIGSMIGINKKNKN